VELLKGLFNTLADPRLYFLSALVAHTAWHWAVDRGTALMTYRLPEFTLQDMAAGIRLLMVIIAAAGLVWLVSLWMGKPTDDRRSESLDSPANN
jgi:hypothetical protein